MRKLFCVLLLLALAFSQAAQAIAPLNPYKVALSYEDGKSVEPTGFAKLLVGCFESEQPAFNQPKVIDFEEFAKEYNPEFDTNEIKRFSQDAEFDRETNCYWASVWSNSFSYDEYGFPGVDMYKQVKLVVFSSELNKTVYSNAVPGKTILSHRAVAKLSYNGALTLEEGKPGFLENELQPFSRFLIPFLIIFLAQLLAANSFINGRKEDAKKYSKLRVFGAVAAVDLLGLLVYVWKIDAYYFSWLVPFVAFLFAAAAVLQGILFKFLNKEFSFKDSFWLSLKITVVAIAAGLVGFFFMAFTSYWISY